MADKLEENEILDQDGEQEEDEEQMKKKGNEKLLYLTQKGQIEDLKKILEKKQYSNINIEDKKKWTPLVWASCKNYVDIVRLLLSYDAHKYYLEENQQDKKTTLGHINNQCKQSPLQWSTYKGNINIVWLLLNKGISWEDTDSFGNNCVHLAASGGDLKVFQCYMMLGVEVDALNSRGHKAYDLATNEHIKELIKSHKQSKTCAKTGEEFNSYIKKHWCSTCLKFFCDKAYRIEWSWDTHESQEKERLDGKCISCWENIAQKSEGLKDKMKEYEYKGLSEKLQEIEDFGIEIDLKLLNEAKVIQERLRTQNQIKDFINSLKIVENYKTILKSANIIAEIRENAKQRGVQLDQDILELMQQQIDRLVSERNLRFELDNIDGGDCNPEQVKNLENLINIAKEKGVAQNYLDDAEVLKGKMARSIQCSDIFKQFCDYPVRPEYIEPIYIDRKTQKPFDPITKKPADLKLLAAPPKKSKKKVPKYITPEWSNNLDEFMKVIITIEELLKQAEELDLKKEFIDKCNEQIIRMRKEHKHRKGHELQDKIVAEYKAAQKKKK